LTGSGTNKIGTRGDLAQVLSTNGNLHIDAGVGKHIYLNYYGGTDMYFCNGSGTIHSVFKQNGNFGIGTTTPAQKLYVVGNIQATNSMLCAYLYVSQEGTFSGGCRIYGTEHTQDYTNAASDWLTNGGSVQADPPNLNFGLYVAEFIRAYGIVVFSDQRIKSNIVDIDDTTALDQIRKLKPKYYEYVDKVKKGVSSVRLHRTGSQSSSPKSSLCG